MHKSFSFLSILFSSKLKNLFCSKRARVHKDATVADIFVMDSMTKYETAVRFKTESSADRKEKGKIRTRGRRIEDRDNRIGFEQLLNEVRGPRSYMHTRHTRSAISLCECMVILLTCVGLWRNL